jgi:hypothetical protein
LHLSKAAYGKVTSEKAGEENAKLDARKPIERSESPVATVIVRLKRPRSCSSSAIISPEQFLRSQAACGPWPTISMMRGRSIMHQIAQQLFRQQNL